MNKDWMNKISEELKEEEKVVYGEYDDSETLELEDWFKELNLFDKLAWNLSSETTNLIAEYVAIDKKEDPDFREHLLKAVKNASRDRLMEKEAQELLKRFGGVGEYLKILRKQRDLSQDEIATNLNLSPKLLESVEGGEASILKMDPYALGRFIKAVSDSYHLILKMIWLTMRNNLKNNINDMVTEALPRMEKDLSQKERFSEIISVTIETIEPKRKEYEEFLEKLVICFQRNNAT